MWVWEWVRQLAFLAVVSSLAHLLLPDGEMRPYVRYVVSLVLLALLLEPLLAIGGLNGRNSWLEAISGGVWPGEAGGRAWVEAGQDLAARAEARVSDVYAERLGEQVEALLTLADGGDPVVRVELDGGGRLERVRIDGVPAGSGPRVRDLVARLLGVPDGVVQVEERG